MRFNLYTIFDLPPFTADQAIIKAAFRKKVKYYHPDAHNIRADYAEEQTRILNQAYRILSDPVKKADYDRYLFQTKDKPVV